MKPRVIIFENPQEIPEYVVNIITEGLKKKKNLTMALPTGKTIIPTYKELSKNHKKDKLDFSKTHIFDLDEYVGLKPEHKKSFKYFMDKNLFTKINVKEENIHYLSGSALNIGKECEQYEEKIKKTGGFDLTILGLGVNGHIAFNEPGSPFDSRTREIVLAHETVRSNFGLFSILRAPKRALTVGIATILKSKKIILIATGGHKTKAVKAMLESPISTDCPASSLRKHKDVTVLLDKKAASLLKKE
ncbi:MAG: glucosamine-6-phosphate deaminase [archaeon]